MLLLCRESLFVQLKTPAARAELPRRLPLALGVAFWAEPRAA